MILTELKRHPVAYVVLVLSSLAFLWLFFKVWPDRNVERILIVIYAAWYFFWGVFTHRTNNTINQEVVKEYGLVATLGAILLLMLSI